VAQQCACAILVCLVPQRAVCSHITGFLVLAVTHTQCLGGFPGGGGIALQPSPPDGRSNRASILPFPPSDHVHTHTATRPASACLVSLRHAQTSALLLPTPLLVLARSCLLSPWRRPLVLPAASWRPHWCSGQTTRPRAPGCHVRPPVKRGVSVTRVTVHNRPAIGVAAIGVALSNSGRLPLAATSPSMPHRLI
jgi:hypothetical protein